MTLDGRYQLDDALPWSKEDRIGFVISTFISALIFTAMMMWIFSGTNAGYVIDTSATVGRRVIYKADPNYVSPLAMGLIWFVAALVLNMTPVKKLSGFYQYLVCALGMLVWRAIFNSEHVTNTFSFVMISLIYALMVFCVLRVNLWYLWDNPTRRTTYEKSLHTIFYTGMPWFGIGMGLYRLVGIGVNPATTEFITLRGKMTEVIPEDSKLAEHEDRMKHVNAHARMDAKDKDSVSETI